MSETTIDLSQLPAPEAIRPLGVEVIVAEVQAALIARAQARDVDLSDALRESDPATILIEAQAVRETLGIAQTNDAVRAVLAAYARGGNLDNLVYPMVERETIRPADPDAVPPVAAETESDARLLRRYILAWSRLSAGGQRKSFKAVGLDAHPDVYDISASTPAPCYVTIHVLDRDGAEAPEVIAAVAEAMTDRTRVPMGDRITVQAAEVIDYTVEVAVAVRAGTDAGLVEAAIRDAVENYTTWSEVIGKTPLGRTISRNVIIAVAGGVEGLTDISVAEPAASIACGIHQAARCIGITVDVTVEGA